MPPKTQMGGSEAIIDALVRGITKKGGRVLLSSHVDEIMIEGGRASGVRLRPPQRGGASNTAEEGGDGAPSSSGRGGGGADGR